MFGNIAYFDNRTSGESIETMPPRGKFICNIDSLPLLPGLYSITPFLKIRSDFADFIYDACFFKVVESNLYVKGEIPTKGLFLMKDYSWDVKSL